MSTPTNMDKSLSEIFNIELTQTDKTVGELKIAAKVDDINSLEKQREYVKANIVELIEKGKAILENISTVANSTEDAKDYAEVTSLIKTLVATNMTLLECEVVHKPVLETAKADDDVSSDKTVFSGSTSELSKYLKEAAMASSIEIVKIKND
jgi:hypothetical protein